MARNASLLLAALVFAGQTLSAQGNPLLCVATAGNPPPVRAEGIAEEVGQVVIVCTGGTPTAAGASIPEIYVQIFLNTNITSRLLDVSANRTEALLLIDDPTTAEQIEGTSDPLSTVSYPASGNGVYKNGVRPTVFGGWRSGSNSAVWLKIPFDPPRS